ncbi:CSS-motif domain-containing protein [Maricaulis sp.]
MARVSRILFQDPFFRDVRRVNHSAPVCSSILGSSSPWQYPACLIA